MNKWRVIFRLDPTEFASWVAVLIPASLFAFCWYDYGRIDLTTHPEGHLVLAAGMVISILLVLFIAVRLPAEQRAFIARVAREENNKLVEVERQDRLQRRRQAREKR